VLNITLDSRAFASVIDQLKAPRLDETVAIALADTQRNAKVRAASLIARNMGIRSSVVRDRILTPFVAPGAKQARILASRRPIALSEFPSTRQTGSGITTRAWGKPVEIRSGFFASMPSGTTGPWRRVGRSRLPIKRLWGPTIWGTFVRDEGVRTAIGRRIVEQLPRNLVRRIKSALRRRG